MKAKTLLYILFLSVFGLASCVEDDLPAPNGDGDARDVFVGSWNCVENEAKIAFTVNITKHPSHSDKIRLENFAFIGMDEFAEGIILGPDVSIPEQIPCEGFIVSGNGKLITASRMEWTYAVTAGGDKTDYVATFTRP
jgi:hypothetical protein